MVLAAQIEPPWAEKVNDDQQRIAIFKKKIEASLSTEELESIRYFLKGELAEIPTPLLKVIHALKQFDWRLVKSESMQAESSASLETESWALEFPDLDLRVEPIRCFGIVRYAMPVALSLEQQLWFQETDADMVFRLLLADVQAADGRPSVAGEVLPVLTTDCPRQWTEAARLRQPTALDGLCLRAVSTQECLCVLTDRPQWRFDLAFPAAVDTSSESLSPDVGNPLRALSQSGFDLSFVDVVRRNSQRPLQPDETKPLMSLLRIIGQPSFSIDQLRADSWEPLKAMGAAKQAFAQPVDWNVRLVSGSVVPVDDAVAQRILGGQRYFQFDGFVDIGDRRIRYQVDGKELSFEREFPVTILSRELTPFVPREELKDGELSWEIGKFARVRGCFYRLWSYDSEYLQQQATGGRQAAPLILAAEMRLGRPQISASETSEIGWFGYALCAATLGILAIILWQAFRHDSPRKFPRSS
jgi:hypothetical protein